VAGLQHIFRYIGTDGGSDFTPLEEKEASVPSARADVQNVAMVSNGAEAVAVGKPSEIGVSLLVNIIVVGNTIPESPHPLKGPFPWVIISKFKL